MKAQDLRVGNLINVTDNEGGEDKVIAIERDYCICNEYGAVDWSMVEGIPLSPEWLERFGFQMDDSLNQGILYDHWFVGKNESDYLSWYLISEVTNAIIKRHIMTVHQLQNLIYALTGEELTPKP